MRILKKSKKAPGYHRHFSGFQLWRRCIIVDWEPFSLMNTLFSRNLRTFPRKDFCDFIAIKLNSGRPKTFQRINTNKYEFYNTFATNTDFEKSFFSQKTQFFQEKLSHQFENLHWISRILQQICNTLVTRVFPMNNRPIRMFGKNRRNAFVLSAWFTFNFWMWAEKRHKNWRLLLQADKQITSGNGSGKIRQPEERS